MNKNFVNYMNTLSKLNRNDNIRKAAEQDTVQIYSALALALFELLDGTEEEKQESINIIFAKSGDYWMDAIEKGQDIVKVCEEVTGIKVAYSQDTQPLE